MPPGYHVEYGGQFESAEQASQTLLLLGSGVLVGIFLLLFMAFHSTRDALLVMLNLPLAMIGGVLGVYVSGGILSVAAIIGLSIVYRAFDNFGGFRSVFGVQPNKKAAVLTFGFVHGLGLATKLQDFALSADGLVPNMVAFNVGVAPGQLMALGMILVVMRYWRSTPSFGRHALTGNFALMAAGFILAGYQFTGFITQ